VRNAQMSGRKTASGGALLIVMVFLLRDSKNNQQ
jgi:hypothetical protein